MYMLIILIFYYIIKYFNRTIAAFPSIKNFYETLISSPLKTTVFLILPSILILIFIIWLVKEKKTYFTQLLPFFEFILYTIVFIFALSFYMEPHAIGYLMDSFGNRITFIYSYTDEEMYFRFFLICAMPFLLLIIQIYIVIYLFNYLFIPKKKVIDPNLSFLKTKGLTIKKQD